MTQGRTLFLFLLISCQTPLLYRNDSPPESHYEEIHDLTETEKAKVDIIWVVDNSFSMKKYQMKVHLNTERFIKVLTGEEIDWKMGMISTSIDEEPYLGFRTPFHYESQDIIPTFRETIYEMGTKGDTTERSFLPLVNVLQSHPWFLRDDAFLVVFFLSDEKEQSDKLFEGKGIASTDDFLQKIYRLKRNSEKVLMYGAFAFKDLTDCDKRVTVASYQGSRYEDAITQTGGSHFSACASNFGEEFVKVALDIRVKILRPHMIPHYRFVPESFKVTMGDMDIPGGTFASSEETRPYWLYNESTHVVSFFNVDRIPDEMIEDVRVSYQIDDGINR